MVMRLKASHLTIDNEKVMKNEFKGFTCIVLIVACLSLGYGGDGEKKMLRKKAVQKGFVQACQFLTDKRYSDAHAKTRKIMTKYPDDYHVAFVVRLNSSILAQEVGVSLAGYQDIYEAKKAKRFKD